MLLCIQFEKQISNSIFGYSSLELNMRACCKLQWNTSARRELSHIQTFSERRSFERRSERRSNFVSAELSAAHELKMSAELSGAHILTMSAELSGAHFLMSALKVWLAIIIQLQARIYDIKSRFSSTNCPLKSQESLQLDEEMLVKILLFFI